MTHSCQWCVTVAEMSLQSNNVQIMRFTLIHGKENFIIFNMRGVICISVGMFSFTSFTYTCIIPLWSLNALRAETLQESRSTRAVERVDDGKSPHWGHWILFLMSFSSLRMREDSCSGVGALKDKVGPSGPEGGVGNLCLKSSSILFCSLRFSPWGCTQKHKQTSEMWGPSKANTDPTWTKPRQLNKWAIPSGTAPQILIQNSITPQKSSTAFLLLHSRGFLQVPPVATEQALWITQYNMTSLKTIYYSLRLKPLKQIIGCPFFSPRLSLSLH